MVQHARDRGDVHAKHTPLGVLVVVHARVRQSARGAPELVVIVLRVVRGGEGRARLLPEKYIRLFFA